VQPRRSRRSPKPPLQLLQPRQLRPRPLLTTAKAAGSPALPRTAQTGTSGSSGTVGTGTLAWATRVYSSTGCVHNGNGAVCTFTFVNQGNEAHLGRRRGGRTLGLDLSDPEHSGPDPLALEFPLEPVLHRYCARCPFAGWRLTRCLVEGYCHRFHRVGVLCARLAKHAQNAVESVTRLAFCTFRQQL
jgi:hypothetical protein